MLTRQRRLGLSYYTPPKQEPDDDDEEDYAAVM
jgi:hypothetical protein